MNVLLDTCVLSEIQKPHGNQTVKKVVHQIPDSSIFISVISIGEIVKGIELLPKSKRRNKLQEWLQSLETDYSNSILNIDIETVRIWGLLSAKVQKSGKIIPVSDGLIASTAIRNGLHVMTRNVADFEYTGAMIINPWQ